MNLKKLKELVFPKKEPLLRLVWRGDWCYVLKDGKKIGHLTHYIDDEETKTKINNLLKQLEK